MPISARVGRIFGSSIVFLGFLCFLGLALPGSAWAVPVLKKVKLPADLYEGQPASLALTFEWPSGEAAYELRGPDTINLKNIKLLDVQQSQVIVSSEGESASRVVLTYRLKPVSAGPAVVDSFEVLFRESRSSSWKKIQTPPLMVTIKPAFPVKLTLILIGVLLIIIIPAGILYFRASGLMKKDEKILQEDPKQQAYVRAAKKFSTFVTGYNAESLRKILADWAGELARVVMTYYDIPLKSMTKSEILWELRGRNVPPAEIHKVEDFLTVLERLRFSTDMAATSAELEQTRLSLLQYAKDKIIIGGTNF